MTRARRRRSELTHRLVNALVLALSLALAGTVWAQTDDPEAEPLSPGQASYDMGRELYGDREYAAALDMLVQAIQADPTDPRYWIGAARAANFADELDLALRLYDAYITTFPQHAEEARRRSDRLAAVQRERDEVNERRPDATVPATVPADQQAARATFLERLRTGPAVSATGAGALTLYRTMLRTGYVGVDLIELRRQLAVGILTQFNELFVPTAESPVPILEIRAWEAVPTWIEAAAALGQPAGDSLPIQARLAAAEGQRQLLNGNFRVAVEQFQQAITLDPTLVAGHIGLIMAKHRGVQYDGCCVEPAGAQAHLDAITAGLPADLPNRDELIAALRAVIASDTGDYSQAAGHLLTLFTDREAPPTPASWQAPAPAPVGPETPGEPVPAPTEP